MTAMTAPQVVWEGEITVDQGGWRRNLVRVVLRPDGRVEIEVSTGQDAMGRQAWVSGAGTQFTDREIMTEYGRYLVEALTRTLAGRACGYCHGSAFLSVDSPHEYGYGCPNCKRTGMDVNEQELAVHADAPELRERECPSP